MNNFAMMSTPADCAILYRLGGLSSKELEFGEFDIARYRNAMRVVQYLIYGALMASSDEDIKRELRAMDYCLTEEQVRLSKLS